MSSSFALFRHNPKAAFGLLGKRIDAALMVPFGPAEKREAMFYTSVAHSVLKAKGTVTGPVDNVLTSIAMVGDLSIRQDFNLHDKSDMTVVRQADTQLLACARGAFHPDKPSPETYQMNSATTAWRDTLLDHYAGLYLKSVKSRQAQKGMDSAP